MFFTSFTYLLHNIGAPKTQLSLKYATLFGGVEPKSRIKLAGQIKKKTVGRFGILKVQKGLEQITFMSSHELHLRNPVNTKPTDINYIALSLRAHANTIIIAFREYISILKITRAR